MHQLAALPASCSAARSISSSASARRDTPSVTLRRLPDLEQVTTVVERRAADVCVVGAHCTALLAAYSLAKAGRKVVLVPEYGLSLSAPTAGRLHPLKLTDTDPLLVHLASESAAHWRGLELLAGCPLLSSHETCDLVLNPDRDHPGAAGFNMLQEACTAAGVLTVPFTSSELNSRYRQLRLSADSAALVQPNGGVLPEAATTAAAQTLAEKAGIISRPGLMLRGWRDRGSCFQLRASSLLSPELLTEVEAETLLLVPQHWHNMSLRLFGILVEGLQTREVLGCSVPAGVLQQQQQWPVWQSWGVVAASAPPQPPPGGCALPLMQEEGNTGWLLEQLPAWGMDIRDPWTWQAAGHSWAVQQQAALNNSQQQSLTCNSSSSSWVNLQRLLQSATSAVGINDSIMALGTSQLHRCCVSSGRATKHVAVDIAAMTPEQQQHVKALQYLVQRPLETAHNAAMLTALTASYRDLYVIMDQMHKKDILGIPRPLLDEPPAPPTSSSSSRQRQQQQETEQPPAINHTQMFYPVRDFTKLPDAPEPNGGWLRNHLQRRYMSRVTAFAQLLPNHLEVSYQTGAMITLWPPMEAYYPGFMDVEGMIRYLKPELKRTRWKRSSRNKVIRSRLGWQRQVPYHNRRKHV